MSSCSHMEVETGGGGGKKRSGSGGSGSSKDVKRSRCGKSKSNATGRRGLNWVEYRDAANGKVYYNNKATGKSSWECPAGFVDAWTYRWREHVDKKSGRKFYTNKQTKESQWEKPDDYVPKPSSSSSSSSVTGDKVSGSRQSTTNGGSGKQKQKPRWREAIDQATGRKYYYDRSGSVVWDKPEGYTSASSAGGGGGSSSNSPASAPAPLTQSGPGSATSMELGGSSASPRSSGPETPGSASAGTPNSAPVSGGTPMSADATPAGRATPSSSSPQQAQVDGGQSSLRSPLSQDTAAAAAAVEDRVEDQPAQEQLEPQETTEEKLARLKGQLMQTDSIMEPGCFKHIKEVIAATDASERQAVSRETLTGVQNSFRGYARMARLASEWLAGCLPASAVGAGSSSGGGGGGGGSAVLGDQRSADDLILEELQNSIMRHFSTEKADLKKGAGVPPWLQEMMNYKVWRQLLVELYRVHGQASPLLVYSIQKLSELGHHDDIGGVISETDHFEMFNQVLKNKLAKIAWCDPLAVQRSIADLKRMCGSTSYMHAYSQELLVRVEQQCQRSQDGDGACLNGDRPDGAATFAQKYRRIRQEIEWEVCNDGKDAVPTDNLAADGIQRRARFAAKLRPWHSVEILEPPAGSGFEPGETRADFVRCLDAMVTAPRPSTRDLSTIRAAFAGENGRAPPPLSLLRSPVVMEVMVRSLFHPFSALKNSAQRSDCAHLLALAACRCSTDIDGEAANGGRGDGGGGGDGSGEGGAGRGQEFERVRQAISNASAICSQGERTLSFAFPTADTSRRLEELMRWPVVSMGILYWVRKAVRSEKFHSQSHYSQCGPVLLRLTRFAIDAHPTQRHAAFDVLFAFLTQEATSLSTMEVMPLKQNTLQSMVYLAVKGHALPVLKAICAQARKLDHALLRHFVELILSICEQPYSQQFSAALAALLLDMTVQKALQSNNFKARKQLVDFLKHGPLNRQVPGGCAGVDVKALEEFGKFHVQALRKKISTTGAKP